MSPGWRVGVILTIVGCSSSAAQALPTPDALINVFQLFPLLAGGLTALVTFVALHFRRRLAKVEDPIRALSALTLCLGLGLLVSVGIIIVNSARASQRERIADVAMYFRSDLALDAMELQARESQPLWFESGIVTELPFDDVPKLLGAHSEPILIDLARLEMLHDSGLLVLQHDDRRRPFEFVRAADLAATLDRLLLTSPDNATRPIVFHNWDRYSLWHSPTASRGTVATLRKFEQVYALPREPLGKIRKRGGVFEVCRRDPISGELTPTRETRGLVDYPVRRDGIAFDESAVVYPNLMKLLSAEELVKLLEDPDVAVVAPYSSLYRDESLQRYFVGRFLSPAGEDRIVYVDFHAEQTQAGLERVVRELDGRRFVTVGLSKQDWIYMGVDLAYLAWIGTGREPQRFGYLGSSVQLPEAAALLVLQESSITARAGNKLGRIFNALIGTIATRLGLSLGMALLLFAIGIRILLAPIGYFEARSRNLRSDLKGLTASLRRDRPDAYFLFRNENAIATLLGCRRLVEIVGGLLSLVLILPFYGLLRDLSVADVDVGFLGVKDITAHSPGLAALLTAIIGVKIALGRIGPYGARFKAADVLTGGVLVGFLFLLAAIPATVVVYAIGVIGMQTLLDLLARVRTWPLVSRALVLNPAATDKPDAGSRGPVMALAESRASNQIGNKARRLGDLLCDRSPLFEVPQGVVLTAHGVSLAESNPEAFATEVVPHVNRVISGSDQLAVRSCGLSEDGAQSSLAGRYETRLNVRRDELLAATCEVGSSFESDETETRSVIVQRMARIDLAGVLFSAAPDNHQTTAIEYNAGLGDKLVSGETKPITLSVGRFSGTLAGGDDAADRGDGLSIGQRRSLALKLALVGRMLEQKFGRPQDIEWGYSITDDRLFVIQTRDVTATLATECVAQEQARLLALATADGRRLAPGAAVWARSDIDEVVESPSPFTRSLLLRLYSNRSSLGTALRNLGLPAPPEAPAAIASVFGRLLENRMAMKQFRGGALRRLLAIRRLGRRMKPNARQTILSSIDRRLDELQAGTHGLPRNTPQEPAELLKAIVERLTEFEERYYALAYETTLLAELAERYLPPIELADSGTVTTRTAEMFNDLHAVRDDGGLAAFIERWGHRGQNEYELAAPSFAEAPDLVREIASRFSATPEGARKLDENASQVGFYDSLVRAKEIAKDESIRFLRTIKPLFLALAQHWSIAPESLFDLHIDEIAELVRNHEPGRVKQLLEIAARRRSELEQLRQLALAEPLSIENVEFLDTHAYSELDPLSVRSVGESSPGRMISTRNEFCGPVHRIESEADYDRPIEPGAILVTRHLSPRLVPLFDVAVGCISENGGMLSHAAIVAREMGIPIVVGIEIDTPVFAESRRLQVADDGRIRSLD